jgi:hypothetical protein
MPFVRPAEVAGEFRVLDHRTIALPALRPHDTDEGIFDGIGFQLDESTSRLCSADAAAVKRASFPQRVFLDKDLDLSLRFTGSLAQLSYVVSVRKPRSTFSFPEKVEEFAKDVTRIETPICRRTLCLLGFQSKSVGLFEEEKACERTSLRTFETPTCVLE